MEGIQKTITGLFDELRQKVEDGFYGFDNQFDLDEFRDDFEDLIEQIEEMDE